MDKTAVDFINVKKVILSTSLSYKSIVILSFIFRIVNIF